MRFCRVISCNAASAKHMDTEQALFYLIEREGRSLLYAHDTGRFYPEVYEFLAGAPHR